MSICKYDIDDYAVFDSIQKLSEYIEIYFSIEIYLHIVDELESCF